MPVKATDSRKRSIALRRALRVVLSTGRREQTIVMIVHALGAIGYAATENDVLGSIDWNMNDGLISRKHDAEREIYFYRLTGAGREKEGLVAL